MLLKQFYLQCLAHASYLIGDETTGEAVVVDPQRDVEQYLVYAAGHDLRIGHVVLTHFHADFVAGHLELRNLTGARIYLGRAGKAEYAFTPLGDGDSIALGSVRLTAVETPGHTVESISLLVFDHARASVPVAVLTGDTLFVGDVGRPDLRVALGWTAAELGGMLYDSIHRKLLTLPDDTLVYPAHGAGSLCGRAIGRETVSTMGEQRRVNYALQPMSREAFVALVSADQPDAPPYFTYDAVLNTREHQTLAATLARELTPMSLDEVLAAQANGAQLLDTRDPVEFAAAHVRGSVNVGLVGQFATWAGTVLDRERPIVVIANPGAEAETAMRLGRIGFDVVRGYLTGGMQSVDARPDLVGSGERLAPDVAARRLSSAGSPLLIDVRAPAERAVASIAGSTSVPLSRLRQWLADGARATDGTPVGERPVLVYCAGGYRSAIAASLLRRHGIRQVDEIAGGIAAWEAGGLPVEGSSV
jgi:glyoxylase-like metal-dependent hydrolase (beta-lactamase superfamily II)/rhodanese-related sulfurtransferase